MIIRTSALVRAIRYSDVIFDTEEDDNVGLVVHTDVLVRMPHTSRHCHDKVHCNNWRESESGKYYALLFS